jgi:hypothetical protein
MGGKARVACLAAAACWFAAPAGCGRSDDRSAERRVAAPRVVLTAADREAWAPGPADRSTVPVLLYDGVAPQQFARHMVLLDHAGYETITLDRFVRFVRGRDVPLPPRPFLLTFDRARAETWTGSDAILRDLGFNAVLFVDVGRVEAEEPGHLTWKELGAMRRSGRWDLQLRSGTGDQRIQYGPGPDDVGPFYAYRGSEEVLGGWRERVFSDVTYGEDQLTHHVRGYRPLAFAPPHGNYGQAGTNDRRIPRLLLERLELSFAVIFTQDRDGFAAPGAPNPLGRFEVTAATTDEELRAVLAAGPP